MLSKIFNFKKKVVLITGSSGQVGSKIVKLYVRLGAKVYGLDTNKQKFKNKNFFFFKIDITDRKKIQELFHEIFKKEKKIDILINNAATSVFTKIEERNDNELQKMVLNSFSIEYILHDYFINNKIHFSTLPKMDLLWFYDNENNYKHW